MLDADLAELYQASTNLNRFPEDLCFSLSGEDNA
jgi:hypothetical protein